MDNITKYLLNLDQERFEQGTSEIKPHKSKKKSRKIMTKSNVQGYVNKQQNRRSQILKSVNPKKAISSNNFQFHTKNMALLNGQCFRKGDIVSIIDSEDSQNYYAQIMSIVADVNATHYIKPIFLIPKRGQDGHSINYDGSDGLKFNPLLFEHGIVQPMIPLDSCYFECKCPLIPRYMFMENSTIPFRREKNREYIQKIVDEIRQDKCKLMDSNTTTKLLSVETPSNLGIFKKPLAAQSSPKASQ